MECNSNYDYYLDIVHRLEFLRDKICRQQDLFEPSGVRGKVPNPGPTK
jgi:hypothetical protein